MKTLFLASFFLCAAIALAKPGKISRPIAHGPFAALHQMKTAYRFSEFVKGTVYFRNGTKQQALLNYHYPNGQVQFLSPGSDTLVFTGKYLIDRVEAAGHVFLLSEAYSDMEVIGSAHNVMLAERTRPEPIGSSLSHSGQQYSATTGNTTSGLLVTNNGGQFQWQNNVTGHGWGLRPTYFLIDQNKVVHPASRRAFLTVYARYKRQLARYLRDNRVNFHQSADLQNLLAFCGSLTTL